MKNKYKTLALVLVIVGIISVIVFLESKKTKPRVGEKVEELVNVQRRDFGAEKIKRIEEKEKFYKHAKEITTPDGFINTDPITIKELIGEKVILLDFWTYSCINCQRTFPYLNAWYEKYNKKGLVIIGVHTPEFEFEKKYENVLAAVKKFGIEYPVVLDNDYSTWAAYQNSYWPRKYLIDIDGFVAYDHIGEGGYEETEIAIQKALKERISEVGGEEEDVPLGTAVPADTEEVNFSRQRTPEIYFGSSRNEYLGSDTPGKTGIFHFSEPTDVKANKLYLVGDWKLEHEYAEALSPNTKIILKYEAQKVFMVAGSEKVTQVNVKLDGSIPGSTARGSDVKLENDKATVEIQKEQLYRMIEDSQGSNEHTLEIEIQKPGFRVFTFTFG